MVYGLHRSVILPKGASRDVVKHYEDGFKKAMSDSEVKKALDEKGTWIIWLGAEDFEKFFKKSYADHGKVAIKIGMYKK